jgi:hypothetical protein
MNSSQCTKREYFDDSTIQLLAALSQISKNNMHASKREPSSIQHIRNALKY